jgi:hypothetical protein
MAQDTDCNVVLSRPVVIEKARGCGEYNSILHRESDTALVFHFAVDHEPHSRDAGRGVE